MAMCGRFVCDALFNFDLILLGKLNILKKDWIVNIFVRSDILLPQSNVYTCNIFWTVAWWPHRVEAYSCMNTLYSCVRLLFIYSLWITRAVHRHHTEILGMMAKEMEEGPGVRHTVSFQLSLFWATWRLGLMPANRHELKKAEIRKVMVFWLIE